MKSDASYIMFNAKLRMLEIKLSIKIDRENGFYLARCPELQLTDQGKTMKEAIHNITEMAIISLIEAIETENIDAMMKELGFTQTKIPVPTVSIYKISNEAYANLIPLEVEKHISSTPGFPYQFANTGA